MPRPKIAEPSKPTHFPSSNRRGALDGWRKQRLDHALHANSEQLSKNKAVRAFQRFGRYAETLHSIDNEVRASNEHRLSVEGLTRGRSTFDARAYLGRDMDKVAKKLGNNQGSGRAIYHLKKSNCFLIKNADESWKLLQNNPNPKLQTKYYKYLQKRKGAGYIHRRVLRWNFRNTIRKYDTLYDPIKLSLARDLKHIIKPDTAVKQTMDRMIPVNQRKTFGLDRKLRVLHDATWTIGNKLGRAAGHLPFMEKFGVRKDAFTVPRGVQIAVIDRSRKDITLIGASNTNPTYRKTELAKQKVPAKTKAKREATVRSEPTKKEVLASLAKRGLPDTLDLSNDPQIATYRKQLYSIFQKDGKNKNIAKETITLTILDAEGNLVGVLYMSPTQLIIVSKGSFEELSVGNFITHLSTTKKQSRFQNAEFNSLRNRYQISDGPKRQFLFKVNPNTGESSFGYVGLQQNNRQSQRPRQRRRRVAGASA